MDRRYKHQMGLTAMDIVEKARVFATAAHAAVKQVRKYTFEPYINHPAAVVKLVKSVSHNDQMLAAAWLHDVIEDTGVDERTIINEFGRTIAELVWWLTDKSKKGDGNRAVRKAIDRDHLAQAPPDAQTIKLADLIDNTKTIVARDLKLAKVYLREKAALLHILKNGDPTLMKIAMEQTGVNT